MWDPPLTSLNFKVGKLKSPSPQFLSNLSILKSLFFPLDLSENTDINNIPESMDKDTTDSEADEFQGMYSNFAYNFMIFDNIHKYHKSNLITTTLQFINFQAQQKTQLWTTTTCLL